MTAEPLSPRRQLIKQNSEHDLYSQFDQLANSRQVKHDESNSIRRRERIKSFIDFDDDSEDFDDDSQPVEQSNHTNDRRRSVKSSTSDYYKNDLITVFHAKQQNSESECQHANSTASNDDNNNNNNNNNDDDDEDDDEWNEFQRSLPNVDNNMDTLDKHLQRPTLSSEPDDGADEIIDEEDDVSETESNVLYGRLNQMEQEQELLNNSLVALTSHFAQVQFRLRQIVEAKDIDAQKRETLLAELETFANRGIPELMLCTNPTSTICGSTGGLQRSVSMATSLMADDVFDDDDNDGHSFAENGNEGEDHDRDDVGGRERTRNSWGCSQTGADYADSIHSGMTTTTTTTDRTHKPHHSSTMLITEEKLERQRNRQKELIGQLKEQLEDLERYAYETGELNSLPSSMLLERQNAIIEQLKSKLPILSIDEIDHLTPEELRRKVDHAVKELVNPVIMKEQLVSQLKTQVTDLERFIQFLQQGGAKKHKHLSAQLADGTLPSSSSSYLMKLLSKKRSNNETTTSEPVDKQRQHNTNRSRTKVRTNKPQDNNGNTETAANIFKRILSLLHVFAWTQLGACTNFARYHDSRIPFEQNILKRTTASCARHWGDLRAHLEMAITSILDFYQEQNMNRTTITTVNTNDDTSEECTDFISLGNTALVIDNYFAYERVTYMVRKELAIALRNLIHHGLIGHCSWLDSNAANSNNGSMLLSNSAMTAASATTTVGQLFSMGMGCFSAKATPLLISKTRPMHVWQLIIFYYELKNGSKFRSTPSRRLSQSFGLQAVAGHQASPKHSLLAAIDDINDSHTRLKRSLDSHFKAFVCRGLNQQMLSQWLRLILRNPTIVNECYEKWSYTASTGFEDALRQLDRLSNLRFCLPTDLAVRQLQSIHDAF
ncbi:RUN domain containing 1 [Dermatophagoides pteronyssinus]|uniref:RUN domain containing 1 n=1 Tax=Dermatophagoides pteronyssinus TaxID=6956 RepID=A0ABQ8J2A0_DERPT|nr:RUN domain containing 1 [Dermatophagoides pteronyssinus]